MQQLATECVRFGHLEVVIDIAISGHCGAWRGHKLGHREVARQSSCLLVVAILGLVEHASTLRESLIIGGLD